jgi:hypothetical protein
VRYGLHDRSERSREFVFAEPEGRARLHFVESRLLRLGPRLFGNTIVFTALKPHR